MPSEGDSAARRLATAETIERIIAVGLVLLVVWGVLRVLQPFALGIAFGAFVAIGTWPLREALVRRGMKRGHAAGALLVAGIVVVAIPVILIAPGLPDQIRGAVALLRDALVSAPATPPDWLAGLPLVGGYAAEIWTQALAAHDDLGSLLAPYSTELTQALVDVGRGLAESLLQLLLALLVTTMFWASGDRLADDLHDAFGRLGGPAGTAALQAAEGAVRGVAWGVVGTAALQGGLMLVGLAIARVPGAAMLGFLTFVFSLSQILAPLIFLVWGVPAVWLYSTGYVGWAVFVVLVGIAVSLADNVVRPLLISRGSPMPMSLIIIGVFGGLLSFGFLGLFLGPALLAVAHGLLRTWRGQDSPHVDVPDAPP